MTTIYDIAKLAGVSASTVSRVINNKPGIKPETRERVQALLKKNDYMLNENARGLVKQASRLVGILMADIRMPHHNTAAYIIEREFTQNGYCSMIFNTGTEIEKRVNFIRLLKQRRIEGAVLLGSSFQHESIAREIKRNLSNIPVVMSNGFFDLPNVFGVLMDEKRGVQNCIDLMASKGHKNIALVLKAETLGNERKLEGYLEQMQRLGAEKNVLPVIAPQTVTPEDGYACTISLLEQYPQIDGIIYSYDKLATGGIRAILDIGKQIPKEILVVGIDNTDYCEMCTPRLTSLDTKIEDVAMLVARNMMSLLSGSSCPRKIIVPSSIIEREST